MQRARLLKHLALIVGKANQILFRRQQGASIVRASERGQAPHLLLGPPMVVGKGTAGGQRNPLLSERVEKSLRMRDSAESHGRSAKRRRRHDGVAPHPPHGQTRCMAVYSLLARIIVFSHDRKGGASQRAGRLAQTAGRQQGFSQIAGVQHHDIHSTPQPTMLEAVIEQMKPGGGKLRFRQQPGSMAVSTDKDGHGWRRPRDQNRLIAKAGGCKGGLREHLFNASTASPVTARKYIDCIAALGKQVRQAQNKRGLA